MSLTDSEREELMEFRRQALLGLMREISENCWASGWNHGLEADLYRIAFEGASPEYGRGEVSVAEREKLSRCAALADCWFCYPGEAKVPTPISLEEAKARYRHIRPEGEEIGRTVQEVVDVYGNSTPDDWARVVETDSVDEADASAFGDWLSRAREVYSNRAAPLIRLVRRHDLRFDLRYGDCDVRIVEPSWLPKEFPRAVGCTQESPCGQIRRCVSCSEMG